ncbi:transcriptional regulator, IclR family [Beutenbergia cavernae DSM 12333]|uniref:Transcriptional regulator, IclR family n=1 Tax=Beutenbergia cavernae (strain ATCC BAA-8 / DSM 12333 / CCUG 43141 / JCM 11478 / NBRC 16432 / NCIMB 13614 / HKI 0122) TaxID=471853 RepID=C5BY13_BEUC1|nr:IclR family transcriptional regulator [Beutenbergia cavernae]ACQ78907.1 transcriptional regulator, IclR family [Beutenbergia cavernae DSM 12333]
MSPRTAATNESTSGTLARGLTILEFVAEHGRVGVGEIAAELEISRSAAYRLVSQLRDRGFLSEPSDGGGVRLGGTAVRLGLQALGGVDLFELAAGRLRTLVETVRETAFLATVDGAEVVYVLQEVGPSAVTMTAKPGSRRPIYGTGLGKAYLAALPPSQREEAIAGLDLRPVTASTLTDLPSLRAELDATAARGYAIDDGELEPEVRCIAAAVRDHRGAPVASVSVGGPAERILAKQDAIVTAVVDTVSALSRDLGSSP